MTVSQDQGPVQACPPNEPIGGRGYRPVSAIGKNRVSGIEQLSLMAQFVEKAEVELTRTRLTFLLVRNAG